MKRITITALAVVAVPGLAFGVGHAADTGPGATPNSWQGVQGKKARIASALSAGPTAVVADATVVDYGPKPGDPYVLLRKGSGAWTCLPDWRASPGNDPICYDRNGMRWVGAYNAGKKPHLKGVGVAYRLQGGSDPSLRDPAAVDPAKGEGWISHPPHIVIFSPQKLNPADYGSHGDDAWIMWPGTAYEHLHLPVGRSAVHMHG